MIVLLYNFFSITAQSQITELKDIFEKSGKEKEIKCKCGMEKEVKHTHGKHAYHLDMHRVI